MGKDKKEKKSCCGSYKKGKMCSNCPLRDKVKAKDNAKEKKKKDKKKKKKKKKKKDKK